MKKSRTFLELTSEQYQYGARDYHFGTHVRSVVHDGALIVQRHVYGISLPEVSFATVVDVFEFDFDELISVAARLLVEESQGVAEFVSNGSGLKSTI